MILSVKSKNFIACAVVQLSRADNAVAALVEQANDHPCVRFGEVRLQKGFDLLDLRVGKVRLRVGIKWNDAEKQSNPEKFNDMEDVHCF